MSDPVPTAAGSALVELLEVSPQVEAAVIVARDGGRLVASAPDTLDRVADRLATSSTELLAAAEQSRLELGREPISQVEVATGDGHVFVVADATHVVAAVTDADPTVGLVFYDLKAALRAVREAGSGETAAAPVTPTATKQTTNATSSEDGDAGSSDEGDAATASGSGKGRWKRRKS